MLRTLLFTWLILALAPLEGLAAISDTELVATLRQGGYVILMRHALTDRSHQDSAVPRMDDCSTQRNLSLAGREQAAAIGAATKALHIPVGKLYSSQYCRCLETAELAFGRKAHPLLDLSSFMRESDAEKQRRVNAIRRMLSTPPSAHTNTVLVTHSYMLQQASNIKLMEGDAGVFIPQGNGRFQLLARVPASRWQSMLQSVNVEEDEDEDIYP